MAAGADKRSYREYCAIARALDVLGERWTLLVVRDLMLGPKRYTDLRRSLPGIATDILTARLRTLEQAGFVQRRQLPPPTPAVVYELSESGQRLRPLIGALGQVGLTLLGPPAPDEPVNAGPVVLSLNLSFRRDEFAELDETYELRIDGEAFTVTVSGGAVQTERGAATSPALTLTTDARTLMELLRGDTTPADRRLQVEGDRAALERFVKAFRHTAAAATT
jgi:DNA-binding HxlR family transcriptional regulator